MLYLATPSGADVRAAMQSGLLACMTTPAQGNVIPPGVRYACDNGKFGKGWPGTELWFSWLKATVDRYGPDRCLWAVAPDVPMDAAATLAESLPWLERIRALGIPVAFAAQDGSEHGLIPWGSFDVLFLAGSTAWKTGPAAHRLALRAREHGLAVHMGRVNSRRRLRLAQAFGCTSCDGTYLAYGPDTNLPRLLAWMNELRAIPTLFGDDT
ncbi:MULTISPECIES: hypothetical protein [unclassified Streptomyces]|uniref:hypothetical protein n=1 Tax=unclassified Streptomyces TaxID=2593676 RepID=UPI003652C415